MGKGKGWESDSVMLHTSPVKLLLLDESSPLSGETSSKSSSSVPKFPVLISSACVFHVLLCCLFGVAASMQEGFLPARTARQP